MLKSVLTERSLSLLGQKAADSDFVNLTVLSQADFALYHRQNEIFCAYQFFTSDIYGMMLFTYCRIVRFFY